MRSVRVREDHPPDEEVEEEHGVCRQHPPPLRLAVSQELHGRVGGPRQPGQHGQGAEEEEGGGVPGQQGDPAKHQAHAQGQQAVAQDAHGLEKEITT